MIELSLEMSPVTRGPGKHRAASAWRAERAALFLSATAASLAAQARRKLRPASLLAPADLLNSCSYVTPLIV